MNEEYKEYLDKVYHQCEEWNYNDFRLYVNNTDETSGFIYETLQGNSLDTKSEFLQDLMESYIPEEVEIFNNKAKKKLKVFFSNKQDDVSDYIKLLEERFEITVTDKIDSTVNLIVFVDGGKYKLNSSNDSRTELEIDLFYDYRHIPKIGINRGAILLASLNSASIIETNKSHVDCNHSVQFRESSNTFNINSNHEQLIYPYNLNSKNYEILAWSKYFRSLYYLDKSNKEIDLDREFLEIEVIKFNKTNLCIQFNLEKEEDKSLKNICLKHIENLVFNKGNNNPIYYYEDEFAPADSENSFEDQI